MAIESIEPVNLSETVDDFLQIRVREPGQKASINASPTFGTDAVSLRACSVPETSTGKAFVVRRPLIEKTLAIAYSLEMSSPRPYIVSVGRATTPPFCKISTT